MPTMEIGLTQEELQERVIERAAERLIEHFIDDGEVERRVRKMLEQSMSAAIAKVSDETLVPLVAGQIERVVLEQTNQWGEKTGTAAMTSRELLVQKAEAYLLEPVNYNGKARSEDSYSWQKAGTRISHMIHQHLHFEIERAMKAALEIANGAIAGGIQEAVKVKLAEIVAGLKVSVATK